MEFDDPLADGTSGRAAAPSRLPLPVGPSSPFEAGRYRPPVGAVAEGDWGF
jgi:hypothetical protein